MLNVVVVARQTEKTVKLCTELNRYGFQCSIANTDDPLDQIKKRVTSLILVEFADFPDAEKLCRYLRQDKSLPIIAIVPLEKLDSLDSYADDFVVAPCNTRELVARAHRLIKTKAETTGEQISSGDLTIDLEKYEVYVSGRPVSLTFKEYELLKFLAVHPGRVFTRDTLLNQVWSEDYFGGDRTVDVHIRRLRSKIEDQSHVYIETVRNIGYRFIKQ